MFKEAGGRQDKVTQGSGFDLGAFKSGRTGFLLQESGAFLMFKEAGSRQDKVTEGSDEILTNDKEMLDEVLADDENVNEQQQDGKED
ncbi:hypothetical protein ACLOJK_007161 [Asimina triloba]